MEKIYNSVSRWNEARYEREYNAELACSLLNEELDEYNDATDMTGLLDALGDTIYVALGVIWKLNVGAKEFKLALIEASEVVDHLGKIAIVEPIAFARAFVQTIASGKEEAVCCHAIVYSCLRQMISLGLTTEESVGVVRAICKSNDTKSVKKVSSDIKANCGDKGDMYISPKVAINLIVEKVNARRS